MEMTIVIKQGATVNIELTTYDIETYLAAMFTSNEKVRIAAINALGNTNITDTDQTKKVVEKIVERLKNDEKPKVRQAAAQALEELVPRNKELLKKLGLYDSAVNSLITALTDKNVGVREHVAEALKKIKDIRALKPLCDTVLYDKAWDNRFEYATQQVRHAAICAILVITHANLDAVVRDGKLAKEIINVTNQVINPNKELKGVVDRNIKDRAREIAKIIEDAQTYMPGSVSTKDKLFRNSSVNTAICKRDEFIEMRFGAGSDVSKKKVGVKT